MNFYDNNNLGTSFNSNTTDTFYEQHDDNPFVGAVPATDENTLLAKVFKWMTIGLGVSAISAFIGSNLITSGILSTGMYYFLFVLELIVVIAFSAKLNSMKASTATICFFAYSIINGLTLSSVLLVYTNSSVVSTFIAAAAMFGGAALYGKVTQKDLSSIGTYLVMGLFGLIVASILNIFIGGQTFNMIISLVGIVLFIGITAWDIQKIKDFSAQVGLYDEDHVKKVVIYSALQLYLDFINIFLQLLTLMGKRRD